MAKAHTLEKKNQVLGRILSKEITGAQAHRDYGIAESCLYRWLREVRDPAARGKQVQAPPLPRGMNLRAAIGAATHCTELGIDSPAAGKYCRSKGITLEELKAFSQWLDQHDDDVVMAKDARAREQELIGQVTALNLAQKKDRKELARKEKALAEAAALLVLRKKAEAIWGGQGRMISTQDRRLAVSLIDKAVKKGVRAVKACAELGIAYTSYRKWSVSPNDEDKRLTREIKDNPRALSQEERQAASERYCAADVCDLSIRQAYYKLLDKGEYYGSISTIYRIFRKLGANKRRDGTRAPTQRNKPSTFVATGINQVWSWDITYLRDAVHATRFYYVFAVVDIFSRYLVHYDVFTQETAESAVSFLREAFDKHHIRPRSLVLHSDNGAAMKAAQTLGLLAEREVEFLHSRPRVSNDNPYSESLFKTMKYAGYMGKRKYRSLEDCKAALDAFARKYNEQWAHSGIGNVTPHARFVGLDREICKARNDVIERARKKNPNRWISGRTQVFAPAGKQLLNPERQENINSEAA